MSPSRSFRRVCGHQFAIFVGAYFLLLLSGCTGQSTPPAAEGKSAAQAITSPDRENEATTPAATAGEVESADGVVVRYEVRGSGQPALVFIHGWCCDRSFWQPQLDHFAKTHQVVAIDLGGHGASGLGRKDWTMAAFGQDVAAVVEKLQLPSVVIVGHSMGGPVMLEAAPLLKDRLVGLVGVDTLTDPDEEFSEEQMTTYRQPFEQDFAKAMAAALRHEHDFFTEKTDPALIDRIVTKMTAAPPEVGISAFQGMLDFANESQRPRMSEVKVPLVCINAKPDPEKVAAGQKHAPQFEVVSLPDAGHFLMMEYPDEFNSLLEKTLAKMASPTGKTE